MYLFIKKQCELSKLRMSRPTYNPRPTDNPRKAEDSMDPLPDLIPPAFHILWRAAWAENRLNSPKRNNMNVGNTLDQGRDSSVNGVTAATSAVCTLVCDYGESVTKKLFHNEEHSGSLTWSCAQDQLVDWLNAELTSQHADRVDATFYLSCPPFNTTADGIRLWLLNLRQEGKDISVKVKLASLGPLFQPQLLDRQHRATGLAADAEETTEILDGLYRLKAASVIIEPISTADWPRLLELAADRSVTDSLQATVDTVTSRLANLLGCGTR